MTVLDKHGCSCRLGCVFLQPNMVLAMSLSALIDTLTQLVNRWVAKKHNPPNLEFYCLFNIFIFVIRFKIKTKYNHKCYGWVPAPLQESIFVGADPGK